jgi:hypothetical protein
MMRPSALFFAILVAGNSSAAFAECSLAEFGHHPQPPSPIRPHPVDNPYAQFSYGSDVWTNPETGGYEAWNFLKNENTQRSLAADWPRAGIHYNIGSTLLPGQLACNYNSLAEPSDNPDFNKYIDKNAPITYSSNNQKQEAWVYAEPANDSKDSGPSSGGAKTGPASSEEVKKTEGWLNHIFSRFLTTVDLKGTRYDVDISIDSAYSQERLKIEVKTSPPNLTIGIAKLDEFLGGDNFKLAFEQFKEQGYFVEAKPAYEVMGLDTAKELLSEGQREGDVKSTLLMLGGQKGGTVAVPLPPHAKLVRQPSIVVILDGDGHPIAADGIRLYQLTLQ